MTEPGTRQRWQPANLRIGAIVAVVLGAALLAWILLGGDDDNGESGATAARVVSIEELQEVAGGRDRPVFWAGAQSGVKYEFTETSDGSTYVRYLTEDADVGDPRPSYLTVATYPLDNGYARLIAASRREGTETQRLENGGRALVSRDRPSSVYLAWPRGKYQVEVYDPSPRRAREVVRSGAIQPVR